MERSYKTLEASPSETFEEIREKFIRKIIKIHPDKDELKSEEAKTLTEAWAYIKENHNNNNNKTTSPVVSVVSHTNQDSEMKQYLKKIYNENKVEKLEDKEEEPSWLTSIYDYIWGDSSDEEEEKEEEEEEEEKEEVSQEEIVDESKLYNEVDDTNKKIEKTPRE